MTTKRLYDVIKGGWRDSVTAKNGDWCVCQVNHK